MPRSFTDAEAAECLLSSDIHLECLSRMWYVVESQKHFGVLNGHSGMGKSVLLSRFAKELMRSRREVVKVPVSELPAEQILTQISNGLRISHQPKMQEFDQWMAIDLELTGRELAGMKTVFLLDGFQATPDATGILERLLDLGRRKPGMTVIITGTATANSLPSRLQCRSALRIELSPWSISQTETFISNLTESLGYDRNPISAKSCGFIHNRALGNPREIIAICSTVLLNATTLQRSDAGTELRHAA
jgi:type II secretory pathway predicted ATPase ExeA